LSTECKPESAAAKILKWIIVIAFVAMPLPVLAQQPSLLNQILQTEAAIVDIKAENVGLYRSPQAAAARDPRTGRIIIRQNIAQAAYERKGAGAIIHPSGIIVTNAHIAAKSNRITITLNDKTSLPAKTALVVNDLDLALLKVDAGQELPYVALADSDKIQLGEEIITVGSSPLMDQTITGGKIIGIGVNRTVEKTGRRRTDLIQTTVNLYEGDSGGPLFNRKGELVGLMTAKEQSADHSSFAIPSNKIAAALNEYLKAQNQQ